MGAQVCEPAAANKFLFWQWHESRKFIGNVEILSQCDNHTHSDQNIHRWKEISDLWNRLKNEMLPHYYYFSMHFGFEIYFDGNKRVHGKPGGAVVDGPIHHLKQSPHFFIRRKCTK